MYQRIPTNACTNTYIYTYQHMHVHGYQHMDVCVPAYTCTIIYQQAHVPSYQYHAHLSSRTRTIKFCPYVVLECCHDIHTGMLSQYLKVTCICGNSITIFIPRNQDRNDRNSSTISVRFLHTFCHPLQVAPVHY